MLLMNNTANQNHNKIFLPFKDFYCGCGTIATDKDQYKEHVSKKHGGLFVEGSSHFISQFSEIVLPCRCWSSSMIKQTIPDKKQPPQQACKNAKIELQQNSPVSQIERKRGRPKRKKSERIITIEGNQTDCHEQEIKPDQLAKNQNTLQIADKTIEWNGFLLSPNKQNSLSQFFCGCCRVSFDFPEDFITHCFDTCQQLSHIDSSHFICLKEQTEFMSNPVDQKNKTALYSNERQSRHTRKAKSMILDSAQRNQSEEKKKKEKKTQQIPDHLTKIYAAIMPAYGNIKPNSQKKDFLFCGCGADYQVVHDRTQAYKHIVLKHSDIVPANSSHIFLRSQKASKLIIHALKISSISDELGWSCPCKPGVNMTGQNFAKHIICIHKGISLIYQMLPFS